MHDDVYRTTDFGEVIFLMAHDTPLVSATRVGEHRVSFAFAEQERCERLVGQMAFNDCLSLAKTLFCIRRARELIRRTD